MIGTQSTIVVGVDDSHAAAAALRFAVREAFRRGSRLDVVTAWSYHPMGDLPIVDDPREWARAAAQEIQDDAVAAAIAEVDTAPVLSRQVVEGDAGDVLGHAARDADYLVVGTGRKGAVRRMILGSVSEHLVRHAPCPVLVVPATAGSYDEGRDDSRKAELVTAPSP